MKKFTYIIIVFIIFISFAAINVFADNVDKAKIGQKIFAQALENNEITVNNNEDEDFADIDAIIGDCEITDQELAKVVGERFTTQGGSIFYWTSSVTIQRISISFGPSSCLWNPKDGVKIKYDSNGEASYSITETKLFKINGHWKIREITRTYCLKRKHL